MCCIRNILVLTLLVASPLQSMAGTVHQWVDGDGITQFSDTPPASQDFVVKTIEFDSDELARENETDDYFSIANQWKRINEERIANEQLKLQKRKLNADQRATVSTAAVYDHPRSVVFGYPLRFGRSGFHRLNKPRRNGADANRAVRARQSFGTSRGVARTQRSFSTR